MEGILFLSILFSFILAAVALPKWIKKCHIVGFLWEDMNKQEHPKNVAGSGGVVVVFSFLLGVLAFVATRTFVFKIDDVALQIFALLNVILILGIVGLTDDLMGWRHRGLSIRFRLFLAFVASIPLVVINAGTHYIWMPYYETIELGIIYPLIVIPIGIVGATTTYNFLAGFNGLEAGQGIIILGFLSFVAYVTGNSWLSIVGLCMVASLLVFYYYNSFPAKVFPGDILTYAIGALIAGMSILGNFERIALFMFMPYILETILKSRGRLVKQSFGKVQKDGSLEMPYEKIYGVTHLSIFILKKFKKKVYEIDVVYLIFIVQFLVCLAAIFVFREPLFYPEM